MTAVALNLTVYGAGFVLVRRVGQAPVDKRQTLKRHRFELPARGLAVASFVSVVVLASWLKQPHVPPYPLWRDAVT